MMHPTVQTLWWMVVGRETYPSLVPCACHSSRIVVVQSNADGYTTRSRHVMEERSTIQGFCLTRRRSLKVLLLCGNIWFKDVRM